MNEKLDNKINKRLRAIQFEADKFFASMLKQPLRKRLSIAWKIIKGD